jgi:Leucine-rich repeat (LRR) protein
MANCTGLRDFISANSTNAIAILGWQMSDESWCCDVALRPTVQCTGNRVTHLDLSNRGLVGYPPPLTQLDLEYLDLSKNNLSSSIDFVGGLSLLRWLDMSFNELTGSVSLSALTRLLHLDLSFNQLTGSLDFVTNLTRLESLSLSHNRFNGSLPSNVTSLVNLQCLSMEHNQLQGALTNFLQDSTALISLDLSWNSFSGIIPEYFENFVSLEILRAGHNSFTYFNTSMLNSLTQLIWLDFSHNQLTGDPLDLNLLNLSRLVFLDFSDNSFGVLSPWNLPPSLQVLNLRNNQLAPLRTEQLNLSDSQASAFPYPLPDFLPSPSLALSFPSLALLDLAGTFNPEIYRNIQQLIL